MENDTSNRVEPIGRHDSGKVQSAQQSPVELLKNGNRSPDPLTTNRLLEEGSRTIKTKSSVRESNNHKIPAHHIPEHDRQKYRAFNDCPRNSSPRTKKESPKGILYESPKESSESEVQTIGSSPSTIWRVSNTLDKENKNGMGSYITTTKKSVIGSM